MRRGTAQRCLGADHACLALGRTLAVMVVAVALGCSADPAPEEIRDVSRWVWRHFDEASDDRLADAVLALHGAVTQVTADEPLEALVSPLTAADIALAGRDDADAARAQGMLVVTVIDCTMAQIEAIHTAPEPQKLHPGAFDTVKRSYTPDRATFLSGAAARLDWTSDVTGDYGDGRLVEAARRVPQLAATGILQGSALVARSWLAAKATGADWSQDYEVDVYYPRAPGEVIHLIAVWREASFAGFGTDSAMLQGIMRQSLVTWDEEIEEHCASGKF